jgi:L-seryl-tRNA(Ser) seleniumtransferase
MKLTGFNRRSFFLRASMVGALGALPGGKRLVAAMVAKAAQESMNVYTRLGLRPIINASGTYTHLGGSLMPPEVIDAMNDAAPHYVPIRDLTTATGEHIAQLTGNEAALVTTGAAGAIFLGTCACIGGNDPEKMQRLPFTEGMKNEVIVQKLHNTGWTRQCEAAGARIVEVEYKDQLERAIGGHTAMIYFLVADKHFGEFRDRLDAPGGKVSLEECVAIAKSARVPLLVDAAAELPPPENLSYYTKQGADLVAFSGGKGLRGPQNAGLLLGRKDLVDMAAQYQSPYSGLGRDLKVSKETMIGMVAAVERYVKVDHQAEWNFWKSQVDLVKAELDKVPGVESGYVPKEVTNHVPRLWVKWDEKAFNFSRDECFKALQEGDPSVVALRTPLGVTIVTWMMNPGEEVIVARRLKEVLEKGRQTGHLRPRRNDAEMASAFNLDNPIDAWDPDRDGLLRQYQPHAGNRTYSPNGGNQN